MNEVVRYECEKCHCLYMNPDDAKDCEKKHRGMKYLKITKVEFDGHNIYPIRIVLYDEEASFQLEYKR